MIGDDVAAYQAVALTVRDDLVRTSSRAGPARRWTDVGEFLRSEAGMRRRHTTPPSHPSASTTSLSRSISFPPRVLAALPLTSLLSYQFLLGRALDNSLLNLEVKPAYKEAIGKLGFRLEDVMDCERDAGLGNGGLGRLAACYLDSMATMNIPGWGYGLRYQ